MRWCRLPQIRGSVRRSPSRSRARACSPRRVSKQTPARQPEGKPLDAIRVPAAALARIDAPDPLEKYRWYILGGFGLVLAAGAVYIAKRPRTASLDVVHSEPIEIPAKKAAASRSGLLLEALKEEIFQLEVEHKQGRISQEEYEKSKAALDQTLERALKRKPSTSAM